MDVNTLLTEFIDSLDKEILRKKENAHKKPLPIANGYFESETPDGKIYKFEDFTGNVMPDSPAEIEIFALETNNSEKFNASIIGVENEVLSLYIFSKTLPDEIKKAELIVDNIQILENTKNVILKIKNGEEKPPRILADKAFGLKNILSEKKEIEECSNDLNESEKEAVRLSMGSDVTFIWGPPGTGKSKTLGNIAEKLLKSNNTLLITAHTNEAVDGLMEKIIKLFNEKQINEGQIIRWRVTQSKKLLNIIPAAIVSKQHKELIMKLDNFKQNKDKEEKNLKSIQKEYEYCKEKIDALNEKKELMKKSEQLYNESRIKLQKLKDDLVEIKNNILTKQEQLISYERKNFIIKYFTKKQRETIECELLSFREKESLLNTRINKQAEDSVLKEEAFEDKKAKFQQYLSELNNYNIDLEQMIILEAHIDEKKNRIKRFEKDIEVVEKALNNIKEKEYELLKNARVVGTTLTSCTLNPQLRERTFNAVIVDEISMAPCPSLYATCALATDKVIQCGDFYQLSPIAENPEAVWLKNSIFDKCGITSKVINNKRLDELAVLNTQYRTHPDICNSIIDIVYKGKLKNGLDRSNKNFYAQYKEPYSGHACILLDTSKIFTKSNPWCEYAKGSWINENTANLVITLTEVGLKNGIKSIGIITPYNAQAKHIRTKLGKLREIYPDKKIEAATVHKYQGREMDMIIFDLIDGPRKYNLAPFLKGTHGSEAMRLINVAATRAIGKLIVVANVDFIEQALYREKNYQDYILYQWIQYLKTQTHIYLDQNDMQENIF